MSNYKFENEKLTVSVSYDSAKVLTGIGINGQIVKFEKPISGGWCVEAAPKKKGDYIDGVGVYSVCYELELDNALNRAMEFIKKAC